MEVHEMVSQEAYLMDLLDLDDKLVGSVTLSVCHKAEPRNQADMDHTVRLISTRLLVPTS